METTARNANYTKEYNVKLILRILRERPYSRADLARRTGLTRAAISLITGELLQAGIISELPVVSAAKGRSPMPLALCPDSYYGIGVYLSRQGCLIGLCDICGNVIASTQLARHLIQTPEIALEQIANGALSLLERQFVSPERLLGIGMSCPGPLDKKAGRLINPSGFSGWHMTEVASILHAKTNFPVFLENNAYSLALYEKAYGVAKNLNDYLLLLVDTGVGGGIVSGGRLYEGVGGFSGEIGHMSIAYDGDLCLCGRRGCLEVYAAVPKLLSKNGMEYADWPEVLEKARLHHKGAEEILSQEIRYLAAGIQNAANLFGIQAVILDGDLPMAFDLIADPLRDAVNQSGPARFFSEIDIYKATGGDDARIAASANILFERFLQNGFGELTSLC